MLDKQKNMLYLYFRRFISSRKKILTPCNLKSKRRDIVYKRYNKSSSSSHIFWGGHIRSEGLTLHIAKNAFVRFDPIPSILFDNFEKSCLFSIFVGNNFILRSTESFIPYTVHR